MNKKLGGIIGIILSLAILIYFESFTYKVINLAGMNISNFSSLTQIIINIIIKFIMCYIIYIIYKKDLKKRSSKDNIFKNIIKLLIYVIILTTIMYLFRYVVEFLGDIFNINTINQEFYNIFDKTLDIDLVIKIISDYILSPYLYCVIILLSVDKFCKRNDTFIVFSGILASVVYAFSLNGTLGYVILNSLSTCLLFSLLAFMYKKQNSIWFSMGVYSFYLILNVTITNYLGWL